jgi:hypothetical protein
MFWVDARFDASYDHDALDAVRSNTGFTGAFEKAGRTRIIALKNMELLLVRIGSPFSNIDST